MIANTTATSNVPTTSTTIMPLIFWPCRALLRVWSCAVLVG